MSQGVSLPVLLVGLAAVTFGILWLFGGTDEETGAATGDPVSARSVARSLLDASDLDLSGSDERMVLDAVAEHVAKTRADIAAAGEGAATDWDRRQQVRQALVRNMAKMQIAIRDVLTPEEVARVSNAFQARFTK